MNEIASYPSLKNKVVIITGGASGIGASIVEQFVIQHSKVAFLDINEQIGKELADKIFRKLNIKPHFIKCDLKKIEDLKESIEYIKKTLGPVSILINNAANDERHNIDDVTPEYWDDRMNINLKHYFFATQSVYPDMKKLGKGAIVNIGSFSWMKGQGGMPGYTTAKSAIMGLTRTLARDLGIHNIRVNCIVPGWVITERQKKLWLTPEIEKQQLEDQCIKRMLVPEDISKAVLFFASDQSSGCTAQNYVIDGGNCSLMPKKNKIAFGKLNLLRNDVLDNKPKIRIGFVGGGPNSFIGYTHRLAARFDNRFDFKAGVFSQDINKSKKFGLSLGLDESRCYDDFKKMALNESQREDGIQALGIMTPSGDHLKIAKPFIEKGIHIVCDKPLTATISDADKLKYLVNKNKTIFALTHNYSAYPMLREAKNIVSSDKIGKINLVNVEYPQGYTVAIKKKDERNILKWRLDKKICGPSMILSEIGTHAYHLLRYVTELEVREVAAEVSSLSRELTVDDNAFLLLRLNNNARGSIWVSSAATGGENGLKIRVYGNKGAIEWLQDDPNNLKFTELNKPMKILTRASEGISNFSLSSSRVAAGHPEGFFEAFANIYTEFAEMIHKHNKNKNLKNIKPPYPTIEDGVRGIRFIFAAKKSSELNSKWLKI